MLKLWQLLKDQDGSSETVQHWTLWCCKIVLFSGITFGFSICTWFGCVCGWLNCLKTVLMGLLVCKGDEAAGGCGLQPTQEWSAEGILRLRLSLFDLVRESHNLAMNEQPCGLCDVTAFFRGKWWTRLYSSSLEKTHPVLSATSLVAICNGARDGHVVFQQLQRGESRAPPTQIFIAFLINIWKLGFSQRCGMWRRVVW
jgi:hypothetical protein